jgi:hypothetical protein
MKSHKQGSKTSSQHETKSSHKTTDARKTPASTSKEQKQENHSNH